MTKTMKRTFVGISLIIAIVAGFFVFLESKKEYIGGNVLHLPLTNTAEGLLPSPFAGDGLITKFFFRTLFLADSNFKNYNFDLVQDYKVLDDGYTYQIVLKSE